MAMKVSLFSTGFSNWPIERTFAAAAACGFDGVDIGGFRPHGYAPDILGDVADIRTRILACVEKYQMPIVSYVPENTGSPHSFVFQDKALNEISVEYFKSTIDAAKLIGAPLVMLAEKAGVTVMIEPVTPFEGKIVCSSDDCKWLLDSVDSDALEVCLDLACPLTCGEPISEYFDKMPGKIREIHFIDAEPDCEDHLIPGDGAMDWPRIVKYLKRVGYDGYLALELFSRYANEPDFSAERGIEVIRGLLAAN